MFRYVTQARVIDRPTIASTEPQVLPSEGWTDKVRSDHIRNELQDPGVFPLHQEHLVQRPVLERTLPRIYAPLFLQNVVFEYVKKIFEEQGFVC
jgi:hypothetical protein